MTLYQTRFIEELHPSDRKVVFANRSGRPRFNPRSSHIKDSKMVLGATLLNTQHYEVKIKGKMEAMLEMEECPLPHLGVAAMEKGVFGYPP